MAPKKEKKLSKEEAAGLKRLLETLQNAESSIERENTEKSKNVTKKSKGGVLLEYGKHEKVPNMRDISQSIFQSDIDRLSIEDTKTDYEKYLNSTLIQLSLLEAARNVGLWGDFLGIVIFSVQFFTRITSPHVIMNHDKSYAEVRNWHLDFDLFAQKIGVVPIHSVCHWSLAVVVRPDSLLSGVSENVCTIYHLDSLKRYNLHDTADIGFHLKQYMLSVWLDDRNKPRKDSISESQMRMAIANIPVFAVSDLAQQENLFDCGTYVSLFFKKIVGLYSLKR